jgi:hypothetical protein
MICNGLRLPGKVLWGSDLSETTAFVGSVIPGLVWIEAASSFSYRASTAVTSDD